MKPSSFFQNSKAICSAFCIALYLFTLSAQALADTATATSTTVSTGNGTQSDAQQKTSDLSKAAAGLSTLMGVAGIGLGGYMVWQGSTGPGAPNAMEIGMGGMMILQGLAGLVGAAQAAANAKQAQANTGNLGSMAPGAKNLTNPANTNGIQLDPSLLHTGAVGAALDKAAASGFSSESLTKSLQSGMDPANAISQASGGKLTPAQVSDAMAAAGGLPDDKKALVMQKLDDMKKELAAGIGSAGGGGGGSGSSVASNSDSGKSFDMNDMLGAKKDDPKATVSPEVQAALTEQAKQDRLNGLTELSLFQVIHSKYQEKFGMIVGQAITGSSMSGIAGADGKALEKTDGSQTAGASRSPASLR